MQEHRQNNFWCDKARGSSFPVFKTGRIIASGTVKWFNDAKGFGFITPMMAAQT